MYIQIYRRTNIQHQKHNWRRQYILTATITVMYFQNHERQQFAHRENS